MQYVAAINQTEDPAYIEVDSTHSVSRSRVPYVDRLITSEEAARIIGVTTATLARWRSQRKSLPFLKWPGRQGAVRYYESDVISFCDQRGMPRTLH